jgi:hypothetical protein
MVSALTYYTGQHSIINQSFTSRSLRFLSRTNSYYYFWHSMRVVIFFVCLCFLLLRGNEEVYAGTNHRGTCYTPLQHIDKTQPVSFTNADEGCIVTKNTGSEGENENLLGIDAEEEDSDTISARKYKLLTRTSLIFSHTFLVSYSCHSFKDCLPFFTPLSYKYIIQRVLRI